MLYNKEWEKPAVEPKLEPWQEDLLKAAQLLREQGWCQLAAREGTAMCVSRAIADATQSSDRQAAAVNALLGHLSPRYVSANLGPSIISWNDTKGRTKEEVITALEAAAKGV